MNTLNLRTAITATDIDSDAKRVRPRPDDKARLVREALAGGRMFERLDKPFRKNDKRDFTLFRAFVLLDIGYNMSANAAAEVIYKEYRSLVEATGKRATERADPLNSRDHARYLWVRRPYKDAWDARTELVKERVFFFDVMETIEKQLDDADSERRERRRNSVRRSLVQIGATFSTT